MNKQSNVYTVIYASVMVIVVAAVLAFVAMSLAPKQEENIQVDKMKQILSSIGVETTANNVQAEYKKYITSSFVLNSNGDKVEGEAFNINVAAQVKLPDAERKLPVFVAQVDGNATKYIIPMYGAGLWGPIWGYISLDENGSTVYGAYFAHQGETPGLGAEIDKPAFCNQFIGKNFFKDGEFKSIKVEKVGQKPMNGADYVDAITGGTITSQGVSAMIGNSFAPYETFFKSLTNNQGE
ncbi:MAG: NADH:ubiquinone reductase (Na(+)-transporting) subunit C [Bacteroidales bacterium]|nr:NADH:ubiquinone reductase (Na(+)-transporting) subunit C [Bacteroidales bacterium]